MNLTGTYINSQCSRARFASVKNVVTIDDLDNSHSNDEGSINSMSIFVNENHINQNNVNIAVNSHHGKDDESFSSSIEEKQEQEVL